MTAMDKNILHVLCKLAQTSWKFVANVKQPFQTMIKVLQMQHVLLH